MLHYYYPIEEFKIRQQKKQNSETYPVVIIL